MNLKEVMGFIHFCYQPLPGLEWVPVNIYWNKLKLGFDLLNAEKMKTSY